MDREDIRGLYETGASLYPLSVDFPQLEEKDAMALHREFRKNGFPSIVIEDHRNYVVVLENQKRSVH